MYNHHDKFSLNIFVNPLSFIFRNILCIINNFKFRYNDSANFPFLPGFTSPHQSYTNDTFHYSSRPKQQQLFHSTSTENFELDYNSNDKEVINNALNRGPYFDTSASKNVTALVGKTAYLNCRIRNLGNKTVSWIIMSMKFEALFGMMRNLIYFTEQIAFIQKWCWRRQFQKLLRSK